MARLKKRASKGSEKTTMYDKKINGRDKAKAMAKSKSKRVVESDSGADQREGGQGGRRLRLTREMKMAKEMIDNFNPPKRAEDASLHLPRSSCTFRTTWSRARSAQHSTTKGFNPTTATSAAIYSRSTSRLPTTNRGERFAQAAARVFSAEML